MKIIVEKADDWLAIAKLGGPVVDPMILRCGELFLRGASSARDAGAALDLMTRNIHALSTFFDRIILDEKIPVFNYADSFDNDQNFNERTLSQVNANEEILVDVDVRYGAYKEVKNAALAELKKLYDGSGAGVDAEEAYNVLGELTASGYAWYPQLDELELRDDLEKRLASFILGGLIFGAYAQLAGTDHLMQPKRSRLFLAISLRQKTSNSAEEYLFRKLGELVGRPTADIPYTPTFFPLLLQRSAGPAELLKNALDLRNSGEARDYRTWLHEALTDFDTNGRIPITRAREVAKIASAIQRKLEGFPVPKIDIKMTVTDVAAVKPPGIDVDLTEPAKAAWGWLIEQLPGRRHRKLITRAIIADLEYVELDRRVQTVWRGRGLPV
ncbi:MAG: hypothetical protein EBU46_11615 [Nitrosomonadaceae bacterium]|nr:hypothetical protein [Nitrosomonadaceae bacterium]